MASTGSLETAHWSPNSSNSETGGEAIIGEGSSDNDYENGNVEDADDDTEGEEEDFEGSLRPAEEIHQRNRGDPLATAYIDLLSADSGLHLAEEATVRNSYSEHGELGLFSLFITAAFKRSIRGWTNEGLELRGQKKTTPDEFDAYIGLEMAMSICPLNDIADFWSEKRFLGQNDFSDTMSRARFQAIRGRVKLHPRSVTSGDGRDPLWHSRVLMEHIQTRFSEIAVPFGTSSLDENSVRTKARSRARSYIPSKPDRYAVRFYAVVGWKSLYVHSIWDNGSGNTQLVSPSSRYTEVFPGLATPLANTLRNSDVTVGVSTASALWVAMLGHQAFSFRSPSGRRLMVTDNFYTRHALAKAVLVFTDGETRLLGTVRLNNVDTASKQLVSEAMLRAEDAPRGTWELIAVVEREPGWEERRRAHVKSQRNLPRAQRTPFPPARMTFAPNTGYIIFRDKKPVLFYTNDLHATPPELTMSMDDPRAIECVHGLYPIQRWTGNEILHRKQFMVPASIAAYNLAMNGVDRVDQLRSTNPTRRKEMRLSMSMFTWALDLCVINAFALMREIEPSATATIREFKRRIAEQLTSNQLRKMTEDRARKRKRGSAGVPMSVENIASDHILTPNSKEHSDGQLKCMLCSIRGLQQRSRWGCVGCGRGFHVECFAVFHFRKVFLATSTPSVRSALDLVCAAATGNKPFKTRQRVNNSITPVTMLSLPVPRLPPPPGVAERL